MPIIQTEEYHVYHLTLQASLSLKLTVLIKLFQPLCGWTLTLQPAVLGFCGGCSIFSNLYESVRFSNISGLFTCYTLASQILTLSVLKLNIDSGLTLETGDGASLSPS